jgi:hypothetical protein
MAWPGDLRDAGDRAGRCRRAGAAQEERRSARPGAQIVALGGIPAERVGYRQVERHQAFAVELGVADRDHASVQVDITAHQGDRLADAEPFSVAASRPNSAWWVAARSRGRSVPASRSRQQTSSSDHR